MLLFCTSDIYDTSVPPRKKDPSSVVPPEVPYFPILGVFKDFSEGPTIFHFKITVIVVSQLFLDP